MLCFSPYSAHVFSHLPEFLLQCTIFINLHSWLQKQIFHKYGTTQTTSIFPVQNRVYEIDLHVIAFIFPTVSLGQLQFFPCLRVCQWIRNPFFQGICKNNICNQNNRCIWGNWKKGMPKMIKTTSRTVGKNFLFFLKDAWFLKNSILVGKHP